MPPVSTTLVKPVAKFTAGIVDTVDTGSNIATGVVDTSGQPWAANISVNFQKNLKRPKKSRDAVSFISMYFRFRLVKSKLTVRCIFLLTGHRLKV
jgi:hypothetical protein